MKFVVSGHFYGHVYGRIGSGEIAENGLMQMLKNILLILSGYVTQLLFLVHESGILTTERTEKCVLFASGKAVHRFRLLPFEVI